MKIQKKLALGLVRTHLRLLSAISPGKAGQEAFRLFCTPISRYRGQEAKIFSGAEKLTLSIGGDQIRGYRCNHPQAKRALILHGFSSSCLRFDQYAAQLVQDGFEVLAFDAPAHGSSDGETITALDYMNMILRLHELYGPFQAFIGHSFGGLAVSLALEKIPHSLETRLVLIAPATETTTAIEGAFAMLGINNKSVKQEVYNIVRNISGQNVEWFSIRRAMRNISANVLWVHDEDDDITPWQDALRVREDGADHIRFMITKGLGHQRIYRDAHVRTEIIKFLKSTH